MSFPEKADTFASFLVQSYNYAFSFIMHKSRIVTENPNKLQSFLQYKTNIKDKVQDYTSFKQLIE